MAGRGDRSGAEQTEVFEWEGARKLARDIRYGGSELRSSVRRRMKDVGEIIAVPIRARTPVHQRSPGESPRRDPHPGRLLKGTRVQPHTMSVRIVNNAKSAPTGAYPQGYRYGKRLEFDEFHHAGGRAVKTALLRTGALRYSTRRQKGTFSSAGSRAFFYPPYLEHREEAIAELGHALDDTVRAIEQAKGGT